MPGRRRTECNIFSISCTQLENDQLLRVLVSFSKHRTNRKKLRDLTKSVFLNIKIAIVIFVSFVDFKESNKSYVK